MTKATKPPSAKQLHNEEALKIYAGFLCALIFLVIAARGLRKLCDRTPLPKVSQGLLDDGRKACLLIFRQLEKRPDWKWADRPPFGLILVVVIYLMGNAILSVTILATTQVNHWASRFGWLGAANMSLCVFFGLKNTPLGPIAAVAHTQLNILHRFVGYATVFLVLLHAIFYTVYFGRQGRWETLVEEGNVEGLAAGACILVLLLGVFRHRGYEIFYVSHVAGFMAVVILTWFHRPDWAKKLPVVMLIIACMWSLDRIIRAARTLYNLVNNQATFYPLPGGGTRILLKKPGAKAALPGSHGFLWIPRIHPYQGHPFTIVSNGSSGLELVIKPHEGFTKAVSKFAADRPGRARWASMDGPYGSLPDMGVYDKLIFVSGGSGAAFTFGLMNRIMGSHEGARTQSIDFLWAVKRKEHLSWFYEHLQNLTRAKQDVNLRLYVANEGPSASPETAVRATIAPEGAQSLMGSLPLPKQATFNYNTMTGADNTRRVMDEQAANVKFGKMGIRTVILEAMQGVGKAQRVFLAACGPKALMDAVRDSADIYRSEHGYRIDVHCEDFGGS